MKWGWVLVPLLLVLVGQCAGPAHGGQTSLCGSQEAIETALAEREGEVPVVAWVEPDGSVRWLFANAETDSWTMVLIREGLTCTMRGGHGVAVLGVRNGD